MKRFSYQLVILAFLMSSFAACIRPQWLIVIGTDAPVPQLGDRLLVEVLDGQGELACPTCRRQFGVGEESRWPVSFGLASDSLDTVDPNLHIRARLYREDHADAEGIPQVAFIDAMGRLPRAEGMTQVGLTLSLNCFSVPSQPGGPPDRLTCDPQQGVLGPEPTLVIIANETEVPSPGSWAPGVRIPCPPDRAIPAGMTCIPGGIFVIGSNNGFPSGSSFMPVPERLVRIRPFAIDRDEYKVKDLYALFQQAGKSWLSPKHPMCTYSGTRMDETNVQPMNCVPAELAAMACAANGKKRLPTEAEWEYVAGNLHEETPFPWGTDEDVCANSIIGRGRTGLETGAGVVETSQCRVTREGQVVPPGPTEDGSPRDVTRLGIRNLAGNLSEWVADLASSYASSCWTPAGQNWLDNPRCKTPRPDGLVTRGGSWSELSLKAKVVERGIYLRDGTSPDIGFRCALDL